MEQSAQEVLCAFAVEYHPIIQTVLLGTQPHLDAAKVDTNAARRIQNTLAHLAVQIANYKAYYRQRRLKQGNGVQFPDFALLSEILSALEQDHPTQRLPNTNNQDSEQWNETLHNRAEWTLSRVHEALKREWNGVEKTAKLHPMHIVEQFGYYWNSEKNPYKTQQKKAEEQRRAEEQRKAEEQESERTQEKETLGENETRDERFARAFRMLRRFGLTVLGVQAVIDAVRREDDGIL
ncbi:Hypothetical predicted protein [Lecanosticta acicola]|uniref:Uncharacterized protein n=1 Tax=Lecanosticta acicola TaxID=111012 RepID=A0AAI8YYL2_9PEZI|nr:Hypothetical predicted protein [Lecanosticta acicola]